jgi:hypothetical protein
VDAGVEHLVGLGEDRLGAVAVVDIPVEHEHSLGPTGLDRVSGGDGDVVEQAEAHRTCRLRVVARWAQRAEREPVLACQQPLGRIQRPTGRVERRLERALAPHGVDVEHAATARRESLDRIDVLRRVNAGELLTGGGRCLDSLEARPASLVERGLDGAEPRGILRVGAGVVLQRAWVGEVEPHGRRYGTRA